MKTLYRFSPLAYLLVVILLINNPAQPLVTQDVGLLRVGIIGDSLTDEYRADDNRGGSYAPVTLNWVEQLVRGNKIDAGQWGTFSTPRRSGYAQNLAHSGATTTSMLSEGQHTGLAGQTVDVVIINIGQNDFAPYADGMYADIYNGVLSGSALTTRINQVIANIQTAIATLRSTTPNLPIVLTLLANWNNSPVVYLNYPDINKRQLVANAIAQVNTGLLAIQNVTILDADAFFASLPVDQTGHLLIGTVSINMAGVGNEPHNAVLGDSIHPGTVLQGLTANAYIDRLNSATGGALTPLTDNEILSNAGLQVILPTDTATPTNTSTSTDTPTYTLTPTEAVFPICVSVTPILTDTPVPTDTSTPTASATDTPVVASATYTASATKTNTPTVTLVPSATRTATAVPTNAPPIAVNDVITMGSNSSMFIAYALLLQNDSDVNGDTLTVIGGTQPVHGVFTNVTAAGATYVRNPSFSVDTFTYTISDGHGHTAIATVTINS